MEHNYNYNWNEHNNTLYIYDGNAIICEISEVYDEDNAIKLFNEQIDIIKNQ